MKKILSIIYLASLSLFIFAPESLGIQDQEVALRFDPDYPPVVIGENKYKTYNLMFKNGELWPRDPYYYELLYAHGDMFIFAQDDLKSENLRLIFLSYIQ